jgi:hypothetical protein
VTSATEQIAASFRDPHGFVFRRGSILYRQVNTAHAAHFERFIEGGLYDRLVADGLLVPHEEADPSIAATPDAYRVILPEQIPFVSYPYEWSFTMLRDAALATLRIQDLALDHGMSLRDATAYNVTFHRGRPVFLDTTSFEIIPERRPWVAYRQFCQHFLAPLVLMSFRDARLGQLSRLYMDGVPLDLASALIPARVRVKPGIALHIRMHAKSQQRHEADDRTDRARAPSLSANALRGIIASLRKTIERLDRPAGASAWRDYYYEADHYSAEATERKEALVKAWIREVRPGSVWDLGANTGRFARLASSTGIDTVAFDIDPFCVDEAYRIAQTERDRCLLPLIQDLTNPSGGIGWGGRERVALGDRGPADLVLALALIHHLAIANNVSLTSIVDELYRLGRSVIVEFVPKDDPKVRAMLRNREDIFAEYGVERFESAAQASFRIEHRAPIADSGRTLYLLTPK